MIRQVTEIPAEDLNQLRSDLNEIKKSLQNIGAMKRPEYISIKEWCKETKMSWWKFNELRNNGRLKTITRGKKVYIPSSEITRYFDGEME